jgi:oligoribonuclease
MKYLFCDLETTGIDPKRCEVLEVAAILTDGPEEGFRELCRYEAVVKLPDNSLWHQRAMEMHVKTGLIAVEPTVNSVHVADREIYTKMRKVLSTDLVKGSLVLAGRNPQFDRSFIKRHLHYLHCVLHYRMLDVTTLITCLGYPAEFVSGVDGEPHRAMYGIERDLELVREYTRLYR